MTPAARPQLVHTPLVTHNLSPHNLPMTCVKLCLVERRVSMVEGACFCMMTDCGCAEVFNTRSPILMYSFLHLKRFQLDWGSLVGALTFSGQCCRMDVQIWIRCKKQLFWSKHLDMLSTDMYLWRFARAFNPKYDLKNQHLQHCMLRAPLCTRRQQSKMSVHVAVLWLISCLTYTPWEWNRQWKLDSWSKQFLR